MTKFFSMFSSDTVIKFGVAICAVAVAVKAVAAPHTIAYQVADKATEICAMWGLGATASRVKK